MTSALALTFHGIRGATAASEAVQDPETMSYTVNVGRFRETVDQISPEECCTVAEFFNSKEGDWLILTLDDGFISDFEIAFPYLGEKGLKGTFFITAGNVGRPGYTDDNQLRKMAEEGMEIGSHGSTHRYLTEMSRADALREIFESKDQLEQSIGANVISFAPVGGHFKKWMVDASRQAGYLSFATMIPGKTRYRGEFMILHRNHIQSRHDESYVSHLLKGQMGLLIINRLRYHMLTIPKVTLGINNYDRAKEYFLNTHSKR